jgi:hypothetical protein
MTFLQYFKASAILLVVVTRGEIYKSFDLAIKCGKLCQREKWKKIAKMGKPRLFFRNLDCAELTTLAPAVLIEIARSGF